MRYLSLALLPTLLAAAEDAAATAPKPVKFKQAPLPAAECVWTANNVGDQMSVLMGLVTENGFTVPARNKVDLAGGTGVLRVGGASFPLTYDKGSRFVTITPEGGKPIRLKEKPPGFTAEALPIDAKSKAFVAFPALMPSRSGAVLHYRNAAVMKGTVDSVAVSLYDDDCDGSYGGQADGIATTAGLCFAPWANQIATKKGTFAISGLAADGSEATFTAIESTAKLTTAFKGAGVECHAAFASADGATVFTTTGKDTVLVPPGSYKLLHGAVFSPGKGNVVAWISPADANAGEATAEKPATIEWGGPFLLVFTAAKAKDGKFTIDPSSIRLHGKNGERYRDFRWDGAPVVYVNGKNNGSMGFG